REIRDAPDRWRCRGDRSGHQPGQAKAETSEIPGYGRIRLAAIPDNSAASIEAFVRANVKTGTTLLTDGHRSYPGLTDYRHDPRTVGKMAGHIVLPWIHRVFALMKRWALGTYHGLRRKHIDTYLNEFLFRPSRPSAGPLPFEPGLGLAPHPPPRI